MTTEKYELLQDDTVTIIGGRKLYRIRALVDIPGWVDVGDLGGYIESEKNLSHDGLAWVYDNARVSDDARVFGNARVSDDARVYDNARVYDDAWVYDDARVSGEKDIVWFSCVGSENGTLTCYSGRDGKMLVTRGCFSGTDVEFLAAVEKKHGDSKIAHEYRLLIEVARSRIDLSASRPEAVRAAEV